MATLTILLNGIRSAASQEDSASLLLCQGYTVPAATIVSKTIALKLILILLVIFAAAAIVYALQQMAN